MIEKVASSAYDRTERPGVAWLVLLLAAALVGVMAVYFLAPGVRAPRDHGGAGHVRGGGGFLAVRLRRRLAAIHQPRRSQRRDQADLRHLGRGPARDRGRAANTLRQRSLYGAVRRAGRERHLAGRAAVLRSARSLRGHLPTGASGARRTAPCRGYALVAAPDGRRGRRLVSHKGAAAASVTAPIRRSGRWPT